MRCKVDIITNDFHRSHIGSGSIQEEGPTEDTGS